MADGGQRRRLNLAEQIRRRIADSGPISVADYMQACLHDPQFGYYATRPALGPAGDFITAPLVSQMYGELLGAWAAEVWRRLGSPTRVRLVELGPGDGTLMSDILRTAAAWPAFRAAIDLVLVETSGPLRARQAECLPHARWIEDLSDVGDDAPVTVLANEFLDCLPIRQAVFAIDGWRERRVGLGASEGLVFVAAEPVSEVNQPGRPGEVVEWSAERAAFAVRLDEIVARAGGAALFIDYATDGRGDTLQALRAHEKQSPLARPGEADLTACVDFAAVLATASQTIPFGPVSQAAFLRRLGLAERAAALACANPDQADVIARQAERLTEADQMGELFQVACLAAPGLAPPGFA
jgi:SAM-dependent MidA family methyltransferase